MVRLTTNRYLQVFIGPCNAICVIRVKPLAWLSIAKLRITDLIRMLYMETLNFFWIAVPSDYGGRRRSSRLSDLQIMRVLFSLIDYVFKTVKTLKIGCIAHLDWHNLKFVIFEYINPHIFYYFSFGHKKWYDRIVFVTFSILFSK